MRFFQDVKGRTHATSQIALISEAVERDGRATVYKVWFVYAPDGSPVEIFEHVYEDLTRKGDVEIIPAAPGFWLVDTDDWFLSPSPNGSLDEDNLVQLPVIGWAKHADGSIYPVTPDLAHGDVLICPNHRVLTDEGVYTIHEWCRKHPKPERARA